MALSKRDKAPRKVAARKREGTSLTEEEIAALRLLREGPVRRDAAVPLIPFGVATSLLARGFLGFGSIRTALLAANKVRTFQITLDGLAALVAVDQRKDAA